MKRITAFVVGLALALSASAATLAPVQLLNPSGSTAGQAIVSAGPSSAPAWGAVPATALAPVAANTLIGNKTGSSAAPTAVAIPSCSTANSALQWTSGTGPVCGTTFALTGANTFTGNQTLALSTPTLTLNDTSGANSALLNLQNNGSLRWQLFKSGSDNFAIGRYVAGAFVDNPISIVNSTGVTSILSLAATMTSGSVNNAPVGNSTPSTGAFTTLSATGALTPSQTAGIVGTTTNNNANAGSVGEFISASVALGSAVSLTASTAANVTSVSLTAGDWDCRGNVWFNPGATTTSTNNQGWISTVSATLPTPPNNGAHSGSTAGITSGAGGYGFQVGPGRFSVSSTTTVYLGAFSAFGTSTNAAYGFIGCRRVR